MTNRNHAYNDTELEGVDAVMVILRSFASVTTRPLRIMSADDQGNTLISELDAQTHLGLDLQAFSNLERRRRKPR
ncbi:MAG: hypothetical protein WKF43_04630 [Acidimicrobiales bacterium]